MFKVNNKDTKKNIGNGHCSPSSSVFIADLEQVIVC